MRSSILAAAATLALGAAALTAVPAAAQSTGPSNTYVYGTLGYTDHGIYGDDLGTVTGRLGSRWGWFGVEGEVAGGVNHQSVGAPGDSAGINDQETIYGVGYLPLGHHIDLFARIGYGRTEWDYKGLNHPGDGDTNWNVGGGGQWFWNNHDGLRAEYTREDFDHAQQNAQDWSVSYVRKF
jgi:hypothetical protein